MEIFTSVVASIVSLLAVVVTVFKVPIFGFPEYLRKKKMSKLLNTKEVLGLFENYKTDFKDNFILNDLKENYFYIQTGIRTNEKTIQKYIDLKNKLGKDYNWEIIRKAKIHLDTENSEIKVRLSRVAKIYNIFATILGIFFFIIPFLLILGSSSSNEERSTASITMLLFQMISPYILAYFLIRSTDSMTSARIIEKRLSSFSEKSTYKSTEKED